ncbi:MAG: PadR family transcriptional regulator [Bryobacteraceae bacterium]
MGRGAKDQLLGSIDLLILKALAAGPLHGYGIASRIRRLSNEALRVGEGSMYPALHRLAQSGFVRAEWRTSETNRRARVYSLTPKGRKQVSIEQDHWARVTAAVGRFLKFA